MTLSGVPLGKHTVPKHVTNWMEGTLPYFKTFMNYHRHNSTMEIGSQTVLFSLSSMRIFPNPNHFLSMSLQFLQNNSRKNSMTTDTRWLRSFLIGSIPVWELEWSIILLMIATPSQRNMSSWMAMTTNHS